MTTTQASFGLRPVSHISAESARQNSIVDGIVTGYSANLFSYTPVKLSTAGVLQAAAAGDALVGTFMGCEYTTSDGQRVQTTQWVSGTSYVAGSLIAYYTQDPNQVYEIQADGSVAQTAIGGQANLSNATSGNSTIGFSNATLNSSITGAGSTAQFRILNLAPYPDNAWGDTYTIVQVQIATHQFVANINAI